MAGSGVAGLMVVTAPPKSNPMVSLSMLALALSMAARSVQVVLPALQCTAPPNGASPAWVTVIVAANEAMGSSRKVKESDEGKRAMVQEVWGDSYVSFFGISCCLYWLYAPCNCLHAT